MVLVWFRQRTTYKLENELGRFLAWTYYTDFDLNTISMFGKLRNVETQYRSSKDIY